MTDPDRPPLKWSPFRQWAESRNPPEPEPEPPEFAGRIAPDPDQGKTGGIPRRPPDMNLLIRRAAYPGDPRFKTPRPS